MTAVAPAQFVPGGLTPPGTIDLAIGYPDLSVFPDQLMDLEILVSERSRRRALSYGPPEGSPVLVEALSATVLRDEPRVGSTLLTNGSIEAIDLALRALSADADVLLSEDPCFPGFVSTAAQAGLQVVGVPTDRHGMVPEALATTIDTVRSAGARIAGAYVMPSTSNPTGARLTLPRRERIAAIASTMDVLLIEDDAYRAIALDGVVLPTLHSLAPANVLHLRSLSKTFCPGFRLAVAIGPEQVVDAMLRLKPVGGTTPLGSELLTHVLARIDYDGYLLRLQEMYSARRDTAMRAVRAHLPHATFSEPVGGFFVWLRLPEWVDAAALYAQAASFGVSYLPESLFAIAPTEGRHIRLSYSFEPPERVVQGIRLLAEAMETSVR